MSVVFNKEPVADLSAGAEISCVAYSADGAKIASGAKDGTVKLLDFGIAKVFSENEQTLQMTALTQPGLKIMTPEYASPEQVQNKTITTSSRYF